MMDKLTAESLGKMYKAKDFGKDFGETNTLKKSVTFPFYTLTLQGIWG